MSRLRSLWLLPGLLLLLCTSRAADAQASVYGAVALSGYAVATPNSSRFFYKSDSSGFLVGGFYNFPIDSRVTVGLDLRATDSPGVKGGSAGSLAFRVGFVPNVVRLRPYFEIGGGWINTSTNPELVNDGVPAGTYTNGALMLGSGLDVRVTDSIDIRVLDIGVAANSVSGVSYADAGVVYHFKHRKP